MKLLYKILFSYFLIVAILGSFSTFMLVYNIEKNSENLDTYREREITSFAKVIDVFLQDKESLKDLDRIQELFLSTTIKLPHIKRLTLHTQDEKTLKYTHIASSIPSIIGTPSDKEDINAIENGVTTMLYEDSDNGDRYLDITYPIVDKYKKPIAALGIAVSLKESDEILKKAVKKMKDDAMNIVLIAIAISIILALIISVLMSKLIISPIQKLKTAVTSISTYNLTDEIKVESNDEIGELASEFNKMTLELHTLYTSMEDKIQIKSLELEKQFLTDSLTGLENRYALFKDMKDLSNFHVAILDVSSFKNINDVYGIEFGNEVLIELCKKYKYYLIGSNLNLYRLSGDEIAILNPDAISKDNFLQAIDKIIKKVEHEIFYFEENDVEINLSIHAGISYNTKHALEKATIALTKAKKDHADYTIFNDKQHDDNEQKKNIKTISKIKYALDNFGIISHYQAIVDANYKTIKYEALVRMKDNNDIILPQDFLDISKKTKHYHEITKSIVHIALKEFKNRDENISINICADDISNLNTRDFIAKELSQFSNPGRVVFELVESEDIHDLSELNEFIALVKNTGAKIAIDDFGTGYSNFAYLMDLEPDYLKIDGSLIKNIDKDIRSYNIVKTIVKFAHGLNIIVVAEFIHSKEILKICEKLGVDEFQGYYFSEPSAL